MMDASKSPEFVTQYLIQASPIPGIAWSLLFNAAERVQADELRLEPQPDGKLLVRHKVRGVFADDILFPAHVRVLLVEYFEFLAGVDGDRKSGAFDVTQSGRNLRGKIIFALTEHGKQVSATFHS